MDNIIKFLQFKRIPIEIIQFCIIPYTYNTQNKLLLEDIKDYVNNKKFIKNTYELYYNNHFLLCDLMSFCNINKTMMFYELMMYSQHSSLSNNNENLLHFYNLWSRHIKYKYKDISYIYRCALKFCSSREINHNKSFFILGLLTPIERRIFINIYIMNTDSDEDINYISDSESNSNDTSDSNDSNIGLFENFEES